MNNKQYVFRYSEHLAMAVIAIIVMIIWYFLGARNPKTFILVGVIPAWYLWNFSRRGFFLLIVSDKGISIKEGGDSQEKTWEWEKIHKVEMSMKEINITTTAGGKESMEGLIMCTLWYFRLKKAIIECSGKPLGEIITPIKITKGTYDKKNGYEVREKNEKYGVVDPVTEGVLMPFEYDYIELPDNHDTKELIAFGKDGQYGFVDTTTWKTVIPAQYSDCYSFDYGMAAVTKDGEKWFFINRDNNVVIPGPYECGGCFSKEGLCPVKKQGTWGFINKTGREAIPYKYEEAGSFVEGLAMVCENKSWGYINKSGNIVIECQFDEANIFSEGLAAVRVKNKWGFINKDGRMVIRPQFDYALFFENGKASVQTRGLLGTQLGSKWITIDTKGRKVK